MSLGRAAAGLLLLSLAACGHVVSTEAPHSFDIRPDALRRTGWTAHMVGDVVTNTVPPPTLEFGDVDVRGSTGCNDWAGVPSFGPDGMFTITEIATTKRACTPNEAAQEALFVAALRGLTSLTIGAGILVLHGTAGDISFDAGIGLGGRLNRA